MIDDCVKMNEDSIEITFEGTSRVIFLTEELLSKDVRSVIGFLVMEANAMVKPLHRHLLSIQEAGELLGVSPEALRKWEKDGLLCPVRTPGNHRRYSFSDITHLLKKGQL